MTHVYIYFIISAKSNFNTQLFYYCGKFWNKLTCLNLVRLFFFNETIENLNCQGCRIRQPIDKKHWQTEVLYYVFWSILIQMRHVCCEFFPKKFVPKFVCSMVKFSMPAILERILHLASQTMYFGAYIL